MLREHFLVVQHNDNEVVKMDDVLMFIKTFVQLEDISRNNPQQISVCWASLHLVF